MGATPHADDEAEADLSSTAATDAARPAVPAAGAGTVTAVAISQSAQKKTGRVVRRSIEIEIEIDAGQPRGNLRR